MSQQVQVGPAWIGRTIAQWGYAIAEFWNPQFRHGDDAAPEYRVSKLRSQIIKHKERNNW